MKKITFIITVSILFIAAFFSWRYYKNKRKEEYLSNYPRGMIRIEIENGTGIKELAYKMTKLMRYYGFDVVNFGNAESNRYKKSVIVKRKKNNMREIKILKEFLGINKEVLLYSKKADKEDIDATIILGKDMLEKQIFKDKEYLGGLILNGGN
ncbi:MAG: LytR family transcriptional regulator [Candidatus Mcinerneyibacterium aminivorans]|jgi:calcineurin-like phosphoesterase|uniref:LytR family transcriptional regulator n=1 Tax=Candidatus Mcinerneyibacterium aminivorans TaxID=2703815 RepID=A0A5D0MG62_9BACT|nr:MAG: LytR family transcriptional regulator [Candidatus Mcinerneyibacterium aminivorans]